MLKQWSKRSGIRRIALSLAGVFLVGVTLLGYWFVGSKHRPRWQADVVYGATFTAGHTTGSVWIVPDREATTASSENAKAVIADRYYDFGVVRGSRIWQHTFQIRNDGSSDLLIVRAYTTCGCAQAVFSTVEIPPGKIGLVTVLFDSGVHAQRNMTVRRGVVIETNDPQQPVQELWVQASLR